MNRPDIPRAIFEQDGDWLVPSELAGGPWNPKAQHGGAVAGLLARAIDALVPDNQRVTRLAIDLLGEVPVAPLRAEAEIVRRGTRIQLVAARLFDEQRTLARATAQLVRTEPVQGLGPWVDPPVPHATTPNESSPASFAGITIPGWVRAVDFVRPESGGCIWTRLRVPLVHGETAPPLVALAALSDFSSGAGNALDFDQFVSINPDLTLHIEREPTSAWICIDGTTALQPDGTGQSLAALYDLRGRVARAQASLYVAARA